MLFKQSFVELAPNHAGRDFVVGDIHGQRFMLERLLTAVKFHTANDRLIALGDLINHGPDGASLIKRMDEESSWMSLLGNHEAMMQSDGCASPVRNSWRMSGNDWAYALNDVQLDELCVIARGFPLAIELPLPNGRRIGLVHAEVPIGKPWQSLREIQMTDTASLDEGGHSEPGSILWGRRRVVADARMRASPSAAYDSLTRVQAWEASQPISGIDWVIAGHTILRPAVPRGRANVFWIDTGSYKPEGRLTMIDLMKSEYWQVGHDEGATWGPRPLPSLESAVESWRPTPQDEAVAAEVHTMQMKRLRMLL